MELIFAADVEKSFSKTKTEMEKTMMKQTNFKAWIKSQRRDRDITSRPMGCITNSTARENIGASAQHLLHFPCSTSVAHFEYSRSLSMVACLTALMIFNIDSLHAVPLDSLRAPMTAMKNEVWSYMFVVKVAAAIVGGLMSVVQQNLMLMGIGGGIAAGIHFFDGVIGDGSAALIGF
jgi:hypothetical protein